ncbi:MAG: mechanosensitive ion channel domain-containing protein [Planctomycetota bacterium]
MPDLELAEVEAALAAIEADARIVDAVKGLLRRKYSQAIEALKEEAESSTRATNYREAVQTAPESAAKVRAELKALPSADSAAKVTASGSTEDLQRDVDSRRAALSGLNENLSRTASELARVKGRPADISARLPEAQRELSEIRRQLASLELAQDATSPGQVADRILLRAGQSRLLSALEMLKQEQLSQSVREELLQAQHELLTRQVENAAAALGALEASLRQRLTSETKRVRSLADALRQDVPKGDGAAQALAAEVQLLAMQFEDVVESLEKVKPAHDDVTTRLNDLTSEYESIREQLELGGGGKAMVQVLFDLQSRALSARADISTVQLPALGETRLAALQIRDKLRRQPDLEKRFAAHSSDAVTRLVAARREVLEKLQTQYANLIRALAALNGNKEQYLDKAEEARAYISEQLFGFKMKSCPPISLKTLTDLPGGLWWVFGVDHWVEPRKALLGSAERVPVRSLGVVLVVALLLLFRQRIGVALERTGVKIRRISSDRYAHTAEALLWTSLLALPIPLLIGFAGWALGQTPKPSDWLRGLAGGLEFAAQVTLALGFMAAVCRPGGLGACHFGWNQETLARFRSAVHWFLTFYIPASLLTASCAYGAASEYFDSVGRVSFILAHAWAAVVLWRLFRGSDGILATFTREHPTGLITRWRHLWFPLLLAFPLALVVFASLGYLITAIEFSLGFVMTLTLIAGGSVLYGLALRWFTMRQRRLALAEAIERRRSRQEATASGGQQEQPGEIVSVDLKDEEERDLDSISEQTRALLRLLFSVGVGVAIIVFWSRTFPLIEVLDSIAIPGAERVTLLGLAEAVLIGVVTYIAVRNLPGLLELAALRTTTVDAGTRHAISTLCQYAVTAIGLTLLLNALNVDWAKFGWIAAALSVGLGFGLQEVVANFVCGLIILFERPLRVGDVVTVEGMTGTVTKIQMRATTITNWDRQEFVVPNKTLITSTLLNWTLSAPVNRVVIPVGVAYGSDTEKARQIMLDVAADHPVVLEDPAPMATFEQFADSSLTLILRAYLPDLDNRLRTITELHTEIGKRFAAAGIEIAFPQQDLHLRSGWDGGRSAGSQAAEDAKRETAPRQAPETG